MKECKKYIVVSKDKEYEVIQRLRKERRITGEVVEKIDKSLIENTLRYEDEVYVYGILSVNMAVAIRRRGCKVFLISNELTTMEEYGLQRCCPCTNFQWMFVSEYECPGCDRCNPRFYATRIGLEIVPEPLFDPVS